MHSDVQFVVNSLSSNIFSFSLEPTNHLDMQGIIQLRGLIQSMQDQKKTVVFVSHDVNLINSVATDVINFANQNLVYYRGEDLLY